MEAKEELNWNTMSEADKQKAVQGLVIIAKEIQQSKKKALSMVKEGMHINESLLHLKMFLGKRASACQEMKPVAKEWARNWIEDKAKRNDGPKFAQWVEAAKDWCVVKD